MLFTETDLDVVFCSGLLCVSLLWLLLYFARREKSISHLEDEERYFFDPRKNVKHPFPSLSDPSSVHLSVIIPAYNEEERLPVMLDECMDYLESLNNIRSEVIVVSDGSHDRTVEIAHRYTSVYGSDVVRVMKLVRNRGKGGAVRLGMLCARGVLLLFADADGATTFSDLSKLLEVVNPDSEGVIDTDKLNEKLMIACGSRANLDEMNIARRSFFRNLLMNGFHFMVWLFTVRSVSDTQCGFKMFTRNAARICFSSQHVEGWAFDVELLYIAEALKIPIKEVAVNWKEVGGSKIVPVLSWLQMGRDVFLIWLWYFIGAWKIPREYTVGH